MHNPNQSKNINNCTWSNSHTAYTNQNTETKHIPRRKKLISCQDPQLLKKRSTVIPKIKSKKNKSISLSIPNYIKGHQNSQSNQGCQSQKLTFQPPRFRQPCQSLVLQGCSQVSLPWLNPDWVSCYAFSEIWGDKIYIRMQVFDNKRLTTCPV